MNSSRQAEACAARVRSVGSALVSGLLLLRGLLGGGDLRLRLRLLLLVKELGAEADDGSLGVLLRIAFRHRLGRKRGPLELLRVRELGSGELFGPRHLLASAPAERRPLLIRAARAELTEIAAFADLDLTDRAVDTEARRGALARSADVDATLVRAVGAADWVPDQHLLAPLNGLLGSLLVDSVQA